MFNGTYLDAIRQALHDAMAADERVFCLGEDIGVYGGAFGATAGLLETFGEIRVIDTPIAEQAIAGAAIGAALMGRRPVAEFQFMDFALLASDLICNFAAGTRWRWGAPCPVVFRGPRAPASTADPSIARTPKGISSAAPASRSWRRAPWRTLTPSCAPASTTPTPSSSWSTRPSTGA